MDEFIPVEARIQTKMTMEEQIATMLEKMDEKMDAGMEKNGRNR